MGYPEDREERYRLEGENSALQQQIEELRDVLKDLRAEHFRNRCDFEACGCRSSQLAARIDAAIAKAEGR